MSTTHQNEITEAQVVSFFAAKAAALARRTQVNYAVIKLEYENDRATHAWSAYVDGGSFTEGTTSEDAIAAQAARMSPAARIVYLREKAAKLTAEAEGIAAAAMAPAAQEAAT
jgi:hypothetical protein